MRGQDDHVTTFEDWGAPNPSPRTFFSSLLGDDVNSKSMLENNNMFFSGHLEGNLSYRNDEKYEPSGGLDGGQFTRPDMYSQQKMDSHGGLLERMAARAGFNAPKLNTENVRPAGLSQNQDSQSPFLTIPPGLSPTTLLESPVFLSNASVQPSPTTGKFSFAFGGLNTKNFSLTQEGQDKSTDNFYGDMNTSSFAFKPVPAPGPSSFHDPAGNIFPGFEGSNGIAVSTENSSTPEDHQDEEGDQPSGDEPLPGGPPGEDGYNWRKYGQKQVKGSEYPRSYYKCTYPNCPVKKKVERNREGHITEIIYKGAHCHPNPPPNRRSGLGIQAEAADRNGGALERRHDSLEVTSSTTVGAENSPIQNGNRYESGGIVDVVDGPSIFSNDDDEEEDDRATHGSASLGCDGEEDESESKRRKVEAYAADMTGATRAIREPRVVVQTTSEVDILDDGYRWRKYGQKVVKGNPNPRSYYKCTHTGCTVRKHVERASHDLKSVITTYEGKHNHEVPAARNSSHHNSGNIGNGSALNNPSILAHLQRPGPSQPRTSMARFDRNPAMESYGRQQLGPNHGFSFGMSQPGLANMTMAGLGMAGQAYMGHQQSYNGMGYMLPKEEPKAEPYGEAPMNLQNGSSAYY